MTNQKHLKRTLGLVVGVAVTAVVVVWWAVAAQAQEKEHGSKHNAKHDANETSHVVQMKHINTQAEAEALKPGDSIAMACSMCKSVTLHHVTADNSHVKLLTLGEKHKCSCGGEVTVVGTGKGEGKHAQLRHDCSSCGKDVMFVCATTPGNGQKVDGGDNHKHAHDKAGHESGHEKHEHDKE